MYSCSRDSRQRGTSWQTSWPGCRVCSGRRWFVESVSCTACGRLRRCVHMFISKMQCGMPQMVQGWELGIGLRLYICSFGWSGLPMSYLGSMTGCFVCRGASVAGWPGVSACNRQSYLSNLCADKRHADVCAGINKHSCTVRLHVACSVSVGQGPLDQPWSQVGGTLVRNALDGQVPA